MVLLQFSFLLVPQREPLRTISRLLCRKGATLRKEVKKYLTIIAISSRSTSVFCSPSLFLQEWDSCFVFCCCLCLYSHYCQNKVKKRCKVSGKSSKLLVSALISQAIEEAGPRPIFSHLQPSTLIIAVLLIYEKKLLAWLIHLIVLPDYLQLLEIPCNF